MKPRDLTPLVHRFWRRVQPTANGCWEWQGAVNEHGYGVIGRGRRGSGCAKAHRVAYELVHDVHLDPKIVVCHHCDNPRCVNPAHLFAGSQQDNLSDMRSKRRDSPPPRFQGARNSMAKLDESSIHEVFRLRALGLTHRRIATTFGVSRTAIGFVLNRTTWRHIDVTHHHR